MGHGEYDLREMVLRLAHQIRNPLATIKSGIQLVQHLMPVEGEIEEYLDAALVEVERINRTVVDMQRVIRLDSATAQVRPVSQIVNEAISRCLPKARMSSITIESLKGPELQILADPSQMVEAISELIGNGIEFSRAQSSVVISWSSPGEHLVQIDISDGCGGILDSVRDRMFNPFYSTSTRGTGLGLNIVQRICELGGGYLKWKNSADGSGCCFSIFMPEV